MAPLSSSTDPVAFYDAVAKGYNEALQSDQSNDEVRRKVADYFIQVAVGKNIIDFGGGTGLDLPWLLKNNFEVTFCEPSEGMRKIAEDLNGLVLKSDKVIFLSGGQSDFRHWTKDTFAIRPSALLANFAVLNSIDDLPLFFGRMSEILAPGGQIIACVLDTSYAGIAKKYWWHFLKAGLSGQAPVYSTEAGDRRHIAYLHSVRKIKQSCSKHFVCRKIQGLGGYGFMLVHLQKMPSGIA